MAPYFSVIVPVYKVEKYLRPCLDSILAQSFRDFELILVDDGSPDNCPAICDEYAAKDDRILVIHKENSGVVSARKDGLLRAQGTYVTFIDSDDLLANGCFETLKTYAETNNTPDMLLFGVCNYLNGKLIASPLRAEFGYYSKNRLITDIYPQMLYDKTKPFYTKLFPGFLWGKLMKREFCLQHYLADPRITIHEDVCMVYECLYHADSIYVCSECFYWYRQNNDSVTARYQPEYIQNLKYCRDYMDQNLGRLSPDMAIQVNAYIIMRSINAIAQEFFCGHSFQIALTNIRKGMNLTKLPKTFRYKGLPFFPRIFVFLLKFRLYFPAVFLTRLRLGASINNQTRAIY